MCWVSTRGARSEARSAGYFKHISEVMSNIWLRQRYAVKSLVMSLSKPSATIFSVLLLFALFWPIRENWQKKPKDRFPLSYFPMFSQKRDSTYEVNYFVGHDSCGQRVLIPYQRVGTGGFNQVRRQINKNVKRGKGEALTQKVAKNLSKKKQPPFDALVSVSLVSGTYHLEDYFLFNKKSPLRETVVAKHTLTPCK